MTAVCAASDSGAPEGSVHPPSTPPTRRSIHNQEHRESCRIDGDWAENGPQEHQRCVESGPVSLRLSLPEQPPAEQNKKPEHGGGRQEGTATKGRPNWSRGPNLDPVEAQQPPKGTGTRSGANACNRVSLEPHLCREPRDLKRFVDAARRVWTVGCKRPRAEETTPGPQAGKVYDDAIPRPPNVDVLSINGETKVSENFEGKGHVLVQESAGEVNFRASLQCDGAKIGQFEGHTARTTGASLNEGDAPARTASCKTVKEKRGRL